MAILSVVVANPETPPSHDASAESASEVLSESPVPKSTGSELGEDDFKFVWNKRLRMPLVEQAAVSEAKPTPVRQAPPRFVEFTLISTFIEEDQGKRRALIQLPGNSRRLVAVGQVLEDIEGTPEVDSIQDRQVTLRIGDQRVTREIPKQRVWFAGGSDAK